VKDVVVARLVTRVLVVVAVDKPPPTVAVLVEVVVRDGIVTVLSVRVVKAVDVVDLVVVTIFVEAACEVRKQLQTLLAIPKAIDRSADGQPGATSPRTVGAARLSMPMT
jgi:hypothetical protein